MVAVGSAHTMLSNLGSENVHMSEFPEPQQESAAACENMDIGPFRKGPALSCCGSGNSLICTLDVAFEVWIALYLHRFCKEVFERPEFM